MNILGDVLPVLDIKIGWVRIVTLAQEYIWIKFNKTYLEK